MSICTSSVFAKKGGPSKPRAPGHKEVLLKQSGTHEENQKSETKKSKAPKKYRQVLFWKSFVQKRIMASCSLRICSKYSKSLYIYIYIPPNLSPDYAAIISQNLLPSVTCQASINLERGRMDPTLLYFTSLLFGFNYLSPT